MRQIYWLGTVAFDFTISHSDSLLHVSVSGTLDKAGVRQLWAAIVECCDTFNCYDILVVFELDEPLSSTAAFSHHQVFNDVGITLGHRIAWVSQDSASHEMLKFTETVLLNRWQLNGGLFVSIDDAKRWLHKKGPLNDALPLVKPYEGSDDRESEYSGLTFERAIIDSLSANIAVLDLHGEVLSVNASWLKFAESNEMEDQRVGVGANYFDVCRSADADSNASEALRGIQEVVGGARDFFYLEYPCHSPTENLWFALRATPLVDYQNCVVVAHENITELIAPENQS